MARAVHCIIAMSNTNQTTTGTKTSNKATETKKNDESLFDWKKGLETLEQARDEIALKLHLASMEARTEWDKLDASIRETNHFSTSEGQSDEEKHGVVSELVAKVKAFGEKLVAKS